MGLRCTVALLVACGAMAACSRPAPPQDGLPGVDAVPDSIVAPAQFRELQAAKAAAAPEPAAGNGSTDAASFVVDPGQLLRCEGNRRMTATLRWTVKDASVKAVAIQVQDRGAAERKLFAEGGPSGEARTGPWVGDGTRFILKDADGGRELAAYEVTGLPCR